MGSSITTAIQRANAEGRTALIPFVTIGHPAAESTVDVVEALSESGADVIELGIPFSDPLAEGPVIQRSSFRALSNGVTPRFCFETAAAIRERGIETPLVFLGYYNPMYQIGLDEFCTTARDSGVDGIICSDLPGPEAGPLLDACSQSELSLIPLLALTSTDSAIEIASKQAQGFVYCISVLGVTGVRQQVSSRVRGLVEKVRTHTTVPVAVGFGISTARHIEQVGAYADGAAVGSALVNALHHADPHDAPKIASSFLKSLGT